MGGFKLVSSADVEDPWVLAPGVAGDVYGWSTGNGPGLRPGEAHAFRRGYKQEYTMCGKLMGSKVAYPHARDKMCVVCKIKIESNETAERDGDQIEARKILGMKA